MQIRSTTAIYSQGHDTEHGQVKSEIWIIFKPISSRDRELVKKDKNGCAEQA